MIYFNRFLKNIKLMVYKVVVLVRTILICRISSQRKVQKIVKCILVTNHSAASTTEPRHCSNNQKAPRQLFIQCNAK